MVDLKSFLFSDKKRDISKFQGPIVVWNITSRCNLYCLHCYAAKNQDKIRQLTRKEITGVIDDLVKAKVPLIIFSGGEPLLHKDIFFISRYAIKKGIRISLSTNGTLIDNETANKKV